MGLETTRPTLSQLEAGTRISSSGFSPRFPAHKLRSATGTGAQLGQDAEFGLEFIAKFDVVVRS